MTDTDRVQTLAEEAQECAGMIDEVLLKCKILKQRIQDGDFDIEEPELVETKIEQLSLDYDTYSSRISEICEELESYGVVFT